jgi:hypothetical protein
VPLALPVKMLVRIYCKLRTGGASGTLRKRNSTAIPDKKPDAEFRRMLPAFHHRVRPRTLMASIGISLHVTLHVANINVFQRWLLDFNGSDIGSLLKLSHF